MHVVLITACLHRVNRAVSSNSAMASVAMHVTVHDVCEIVMPNCELMQL